MSLTTLKDKLQALVEELKSLKTLNKNSIQKCDLDIVVKVDDETLYFEMDDEIVPNFKNFAKLQNLSSDVASEGSTELSSTERTDSGMSIATDDIYNAGRYVPTTRERYVPTTRTGQKGGFKNLSLNITTTSDVSSFSENMSYSKNIFSQTAGNLKNNLNNMYSATSSQMVNNSHIDLSPTSNNETEYSATSIINTENGMTALSATSDSKHNKVGGNTSYTKTNTKPLSTMDLIKQKIRELDMGSDYKNTSNKNIFQAGGGKNSSKYVKQADIRSTSTSSICE